ncbi:ATP-binding protein [Trinickia sp. NRRL B-1857]|uniref:sensor histidine kinase n=1 Tax=Trinickia sp. NRRL B-1857 TaxID=3162879 RepID=UPI003D297765
MTDAVTKAPNALSSIEAVLPPLNFYVAADRQLRYASAGWIRTGFSMPSGADSSGYMLRASSSGRHYAIREATVPIEGRSVRIGVAEDDEQTVQNVHRLLWVLLLTVPGILLISFAGGYFLAGRLLSPVDEMARNAKAISADRLSQRLRVGRQQDEFDRLARVFNETFDRLEGSFDKMRRFSADASHELRTPLAVIRTIGENVLKGPCDVARYEDAVGSILEEAVRMTRLLEGLLTLTRAESEQQPLQLAPAKLSELSKDVVDCLRVLAEEKEQTLVFRERSELNVMLDKPTFEQALINLVANAIQYTPVQGEIEVRVLQSVEGGALVEVEDNGPGVASEHRERIFERFYRIDQARSRTTGGSGLGLAIARWAIELNGGTLEFEPREDNGSIFRITLPDRSVVHDALAPPKQAF